MAGRRGRQSEPRAFPTANTARRRIEGGGVTLSEEPSALPPTA